MGAKIDAQSDEAEKAVRDIRRATRRHFSAEDKVRIVIAGLRDEDSVAELCRKEGSIPGRPDLRSQPGVHRIDTASTIWPRGWPAVVAFRERRIMRPGSQNDQAVGA